MDFHSIEETLEKLKQNNYISSMEIATLVFLTAMGPTYLWFQIEELKEIGLSFGLSAKETEKALTKMVKGTVKSLFESQRTPGEVMDLVPLKPIGEYEEAIRNIYRTKLKGLYGKLKG